MNFCAGVAPEWADEIRHPDMESTEYWHILTVVTARDSQRELPIGLVQSDTNAEPQVVFGDVRFSMLEATDGAIALRRALELAGRAQGTGPAQAR